MKEILKKIVVILLTFEAKLLLRRQKPQIIAVTGNVGKTSTKDAIYSAIRKEVKARKNQMSLNSSIGVPLTVLGLQNAWLSPWGWAVNLVEGIFIALLARDYPEVLVLEVGVDRPGDMARITSWLKPDVVVLTRMPDVPTHVEFFSSPEEVVEEKLELVKALKDDGIFIYNQDDEKIRRLVDEVRQQSFGYSRYSKSHFQALGDKIVYDGGEPIGLDFDIRHLDQKVKFSVRGSLGVQHTYNYAAAAAVAALYGVELEQVSESLMEHKTAPGRAALIAGVKDSVIIDDTYNSSPVACERAVLSLGEVKHVKRKIAVLGDMLELGQYSVREHEQIGELVAKEADMLVTVGVRARKIAETALENGLDEANILQYENAEKAGEEINSLIQAGDLILVKASQGIRAEKVVEKIMAKPEQAPYLLVRQDPNWKNR